MSETECDRCDATYMAAACRRRPAFAFLGTCVHEHDLRSLVCVDHYDQVRAAMIVKGEDEQGRSLALECVVCAESPERPHRRCYVRVTGFEELERA